MLGDERSDGPARLPSSSSLALRCDPMRCGAMRCDAIRCALLCYFLLCSALLGSSNALLDSAPYEGWPAA